MRYPLWELLAPPSRFGNQARTAVRAQGTRILYGDGTWRLCATSGLWNVNLGYGNVAVADAVHRSLIDASYLPLFRSGHEYAVAAATALIEVAGPEQFGRVLFSTSGSAANDMMMKLVRQHWTVQGQPQRNLVVGLKGSYHGLTYGSHALTGEPLMQDLYGVDRSLVRHVEHTSDGELRALLAAEGDRIAALVMEPVLGTGAYPVSPALLASVEELRRQYGFLLVADEVATGFGRTGAFFASEHWRPDLLLASKGLTNGTCAAAVILVSHGVCDVFDAADAMLMHAETQAGTPSTCAAILATLSEMERLEALKRAGVVISQLDGLLAGLADHPLVAGDDGLGLFRAVRLGLPDGGGPLPFPALITVLNEIREAGAVVQPGPSCAQLVPALVYEQEDIDQLAMSLRQGLDRALEKL
ncbi:aspartate aminotransferase family protein [Rhizocola hellebori]|uniref:Aspartate aminotransferase family protein n=1 Tax=Rhizocola hellebori TaxID=1392758 RepID=A0A8J3QBK7_9ACTN|nr:daptide-type RiPP biosynthesis aminotransferase [Rhizocola hellebori]GIH07605.1 aspartate aminotransferase family protein [Rhizocola hellebori]